MAVDFLFDAPEKAGWTVALAHGAGAPMDSAFINDFARTINANDFRDRFGLIHARQVHPAFYDVEALRPSRIGIDYLVPIFCEALGPDDMEAVRQTLFHTSNLTQPYHSVNVDINKRICFLQ